MTAADPGSTELNQYVYGIVPADAQVPAGLSGVGGHRVRLEPMGHVGVLVSDMPEPEVVGLPDEMRAHALVLDTVAAACPVLPMRFATVVPDVDVLREEVLPEHEDRYVEDLRRLSGAVQFTLQVRYVQEAVIAELVAEQPEIRELRESTAGMPEDASYYDRIRLGELVVRGFEDKRSKDAAAIAADLTRYAEELRLREAGQVDDVLEAAVLVRRDAVVSFEDAVEDVAARMRDRATFRLVGPQAPYDFVEA